MTWSEEQQKKLSERNHTFHVPIIRALVLLDVDRPEDEWVPEVVEIFTKLDKKLANEVFWELDGKPGHWGYEYPATNERGQWEVGEWHWKLRTARNHKVYGKLLFEHWMYKDLWK
jgi:hypothetical protein